MFECGFTVEHPYTILTNIRTREDETERDDRAFLVYAACVSKVVGKKENHAEYHSIDLRGFLGHHERLPKGAPFFPGHGERAFDRAFLMSPWQCLWSCAGSLHMSTTSAIDPRK